MTFLLFGLPARPAAAPAPTPGPARQPTACSDLGLPRPCRGVDAHPPPIHPYSFSCSPAPLLISLAQRHARLQRFLRLHLPCYPTLLPPSRPSLPSYFSPAHLFSCSPLPRSAPRTLLSFPRRRESILNAAQNLSRSCISCLSWLISLLLYPLAQRHARPSPRPPARVSPAHPAPRPPPRASPARPVPAPLRLTRPPRPSPAAPRYVRTSPAPPRRALLVLSFACSPAPLFTCSRASPPPRVSSAAPRPFEITGISPSDSLYSLSMSPTLAENWLGLCEKCQKKTKKSKKSSWPTAVA